MYRIIKLLIVGLLLLLVTGCVGMSVNDEEYKHKNITDPKGNDEVCIDGDAIARITLYDMSGNIVSNSDTQKCFSSKKARKHGYRLEVLYH